MASGSSISSSSFVARRGDASKSTDGPGSRRFFEKSPEGAAARAAYLKVFVGGSFMTVVLIFAVLSIYWGALWRTPSYNLQGWVVDFDNGLVGQAVSQGLGSNQGPSKVTWTVVSPDRFPNGPDDLAVAVVEEHTWVAVAIYSGATAKLTSALTTPNASYDGSAAIVAFGAEARNENAYRSLIKPSVQGALDAISKRIAIQVAQGVPNSSVLPAIMAVAPQTIISPVSYTINNLVPYDQPVATAATFVGLLYQLIIGFFIVMIGTAARLASGYERTLSTRNLVILRLCSSFGTYFILSLFYSLLSLAFQLKLDRKFGHAGFVVFWLLNYVGMLAVALALESLLTLLTTSFIPFFMLLWIITNISVCIFPIEVLPRVFHYGYATPFYNVSRAMRTIVFGTKNRVGESFGILFVWIIISCITLPVIQWFVRRRQQPATQVVKVETVRDDYQEKP